MENKKILYENLLNQHRIVSNQISDIKARNFEPTQKDKEEIKLLEQKLVQIMKQIRVLFN